ncbi:hypothetical protein CAPTEDRAFT_219898 [Capitella teleta]|uniref:Uncharacterized protein n=1 Tax=Capitella teleta TaxID=283909 RepID=R7UQ12_CAPTE|nr:hypothetical protein CAPTEDRAFT_219898 [Capitella teleta]|eukprot:ELU06027.1 hypothetical protein CAPTEDRAFT_219898 [Capitella teleta]
MTLAWSKSSTVSSCSPREGHCSCSYGNVVYIFGGVSRSEDGENCECNDLHAYITEDDAWRVLETKGDVPSPRVAATMVALNNKLYLFGGLSQNSGWLDGGHVYDIESNKWSTLEASGEGPSPRDKLASAVIEDKIYIFGGFGPQLPEEEEEEVEEFSDGDADSTGTPEEQEAAQFGWFDDLYVYDTSSNAWSQPMQMNTACPSPRAAHGMVAVNKYIVIFGGRDCKGRRNDLHIFDTGSRKWLTDIKPLGRLPEPRSFHSVTAVDSRVVVFGGRGSADEDLPGMHIFDSITKEWMQPKETGNALSGRSSHTATVANGKLIVFGGASNFNPEMMQCSKVYNDVHSISTADILKGSSEPSNDPEEGGSAPKKLKLDPDLT